MLVKNSEYTVKIEEIGCNGEGIAKICGCAVFIPFALPDETVKIKILKAKGSYAFGKIMEVVTPSADRVQPKCPVFGKCGGCSFQHLGYDEQLVWKSNSVKECFRKIAGLDVTVSKAVASNPEYRYRNKLQLPIRNTNKGNVIGFFRENSHDVIPIEDCLIQQDWAQKIIAVFYDYIAQGVSCFNESNNKGALKHVVARKTGGSLIITVVITQNKLPKYEYLIEKLKENFENFSLYYNVNKLNNNVILGEEFVLLHGEGVSYVKENGIERQIGPRSFMQVNDDVCNKIYLDVLRLADECKTVIDAYSGAGYLTALLAKKARKAYGIECVKEAVDCADKLAKDNGLTGKMVNVCAKCEDYLPHLIEKLKKNGEEVTVVLDPPRKGCDRKVIDAILKEKPNKIIYVSCNPSTLARDAGLLCGSLFYEGNEIKKTGQVGEYSIEYIQPYDMFAQTSSCETVVLLSREKVDD